MDQIQQVIEYLQSNPTTAVTVAAAVLAVFYLLNRKGRLARDADRRIADLHREHSDQYRQLRPPQ